MKIFFLFLCIFIYSNSFAHPRNIYKNHTYLGMYDKQESLVQLSYNSNYRLKDLAQKQIVFLHHFKHWQFSGAYQQFGNSFYILSAGWGLVSSEFKLPNYDITFSNNANIGAQRNTNINNLPIYNDFNQLDINDNEDIIFIGSASYLPHFYSLTYNLPNRKLIFFFGQGNNLPQPMVNQNTFEFINFPSLNNRSWHYELANLLCEDNSI